MLIEFLSQKGCVPQGYIGEYPDEHAENLIKAGVAKKHTPVVDKPVKTSVSKEQK